MEILLQFNPGMAGYGVIDKLPWQQRTFISAQVF